VSTSSDISMEQLISGSPLFANLDDTGRQQLLAGGTEERFPKGTVIVKEGDPGDAFYFISRGSVEVPLVVDFGPMTPEWSEAMRRIFPVVFLLMACAKTPPPTTKTMSTEPPGAEVQTKPSPVVVKSIELPVPEAQPTHIVDPASAWSRVMSEAIDDQGRLDLDSLKADADDLETWVAYVATASPRLTPDDFDGDEDLLAFYINAYNSLVIYIAVRSGSNPSESEQFFGGVKVTVGQESMTLNDLQARARKVGDPRVHFALSNLTAGGVPLRKVRWKGSELDEQLDKAVNVALEQGKLISVDDAAKKVKVAGWLEPFAQDFNREGGSLLQFLNDYREAKLPDEYKLDYVKVDSTFTVQTPASK